MSGGAIPEGSELSGVPSGYGVSDDSVVVVVVGGGSVVVVVEVVVVVDVVVVVVVGGVQVQCRPCPGCQDHEDCPKLVFSTARMLRAFTACCPKGAAPAVELITPLSSPTAAANTSSCQVLKDKKPTLNRCWSADARRGRASRLSASSSISSMRFVTRATWHPHVTRRPTQSQKLANWTGATHWYLDLEDDARRPHILRTAATTGVPLVTTRGDNTQEPQRDAAMRSAPRVSRIITGGQAGVDRAATDVAVLLGIPYGGVVPAGGWAEDLPHPPGVLARYPAFEEGGSDDPAVRTAANVGAADALLVLTIRHSRSAGTDLALRLASDMGIPIAVVDLLAPDPEGALREFLGALAPGSGLNVAGPRASEAPGVYQLARDVLLACSGDLGAGAC